MSRYLNIFIISLFSVATLIFHYPATCLLFGPQSAFPTSYTSKSGIQKFRRNDLNTILHSTHSPHNHHSSSSATPEQKKGIKITTPSSFAKPSLLHTIHIQPFLSKEDSNKCLKLAHDFAKETKCWEESSDRHVSYKTIDFEVEECYELSVFLDQIGFHERIKERLSNAFSIDKDDMEYLDFFCAHYQADNIEQEEETRAKIMDRLAFHRDGSLLSFSVLLSEPSSFTGGGTIFDCLRDYDYDENNTNNSSDDSSEKVHDERTQVGEVLNAEKGVICPTGQGDCVLHCGKMLHGADVVKSGSRTVFIGFMDVSPRLFTPGVLPAACKDWGRMDVAKKQYEQQTGMLKKQKSKYGWYCSKNRWSIASSSTSSSRDQGKKLVIPFLPSVSYRADSEYQRYHRLLTEDLLLQDILLPKALEMDGNSLRHDSVFNGDITILESELD